MWYVYSENLFTLEMLFPELVIFTETVMIACIFSVESAMGVNVNAQADSNSRYVSAVLR